MLIGLELHLSRNPSIELSVDTKVGGCLCMGILALQPGALLTRRGWFHCLVERDDGNRPDETIDSISIGLLGLSLLVFRVNPPTQPDIELDAVDQRTAAIRGD